MNAKQQKNTLQLLERSWRELACAIDGFVLVMANVGVMSTVIIVHSELLSTHLEGINFFCDL